MTGALTAGAFISTPAFADDASITTVNSMYALKMAIGNPAVQHIALGAALAPDSTSDYADLEVTASKTLDLNGFGLQVDHVGVTGSGTTFTVENSVAAPDAPPYPTMEVSGNRSPSATDSSPVTGVLLGNGTSLHVTSGVLDAGSAEGGAGIGSDGDGSASFIADGSALVTASGHDNEDNGHGGAGIGGAMGENGIHVTVADDAQVYAYGGNGAAGVGGGYGGDGGDVTVSGGWLSANQDDFNGSASTAAFPASSIGGGQGSTAARGFGSLQVARDGSLQLDADTPLYIPAGTTVENAGSMYLTDADGTGAKEVLGSGTIHNLGTIDTETGDGDGNNTPVDPDALIATTIAVTGYNYAVAVDANGGTITDAKATSRHLLTSSLSDVLGYHYSVASPSAGSDFWQWNTKADGTGTDVADDTNGDLAALGTSSDGTPVPATLHAKFAHKPVATKDTLPDGMVGTAYRASLPISGDGLSYSVEGGGSSSSTIPGLPDGLSIDPSTGVISGTPTEAINRTVTFYVQGPRVGDDFTYHFTVTAAPVVAPAPTAPVLPTVAKTTVKLGHDVHVAVAATSSLPVTYTLESGALPKGVQLDRTSGLISGSPSESGTFSVVVKASNSVGSASTSVVIVVPEVKDLLDTTNHVPAVKVGASKVPLKVAGFKKGEHWTVKVDGKVVEHGTMKKAGTLSVSVHLKKALRDKVHTITIAGSRAVTDKSTRAATTVTVTSLAARKTLKVHTVSANGMKLVAVEKLAAGEHVVVKDGAKVIASGNASEYGIFAFPQSKAGKGTSKLTVHGAAAKRAGKLTVKNPKH